MVYAKGIASPDGQGSFAGVTTNNDPHRKSTPVICLCKKVTGGPFYTERTRSNNLQYYGFIW